jgi:hypothetical protein
LVNVWAATAPKNTPVTQPRFWPVIVTTVPPVSLASEPGLAVEVEIDVMVGAGT